jgi:hypothetical protein
MEYQDILKSLEDEVVCWAVVTAAGGRFIGKAVNYDTLEKYHEEADKKDHLPLLQLSPVFDFAASLLPGPKGLSRVPFCSTLDFTLESMILSVQPTAVYLFHDMQEGDLTQYKTFVKHALSQAMEHRASRSGIIRPGT